MVLKTYLEARSPGLQSWLQHLLVFLCALFPCVYDEGTAPASEGDCEDWVPIAQILLAAPGRAR